MAKPLVDVKNKSYEEIRMECLQRNILFEDPEFPATMESLFYSQRPNATFTWKRPHVCLVLLFE